MSESLLKAAISESTEEFAKIFRQELLAGMRMKKEAPAMQVSYNGFTGELYKLERRSRFSEESFYNLEIFDIEKKCNMQFFGVKLEDLKFFGGAVTFGG